MSHEMRTPSPHLLIDPRPALLLAVLIIGFALVHPSAAQPRADAHVGKPLPATFAYTDDASTHRAKLPPWAAPSLQPPSPGHAPPTTQSTDDVNLPGPPNRVPVDNGLIWLITAGGLFALVTLYDPQHHGLRSGWVWGSFDTGAQRSPPLTRCRTSDVFDALDRAAEGPIFLRDANGRVQRANGAFQALLSDVTAIQGSRPADLFDVYQKMHATGRAERDRSLTQHSGSGLVSSRGADNEEFVTVEHGNGRSCFRTQRMPVQDETGRNAGEIVVWTARTPKDTSGEYGERFRTVKPAERLDEWHDASGPGHGTGRPRLDSNVNVDADPLMFHVQHEIRTLMTTILGFSEILLGSLEGQEHRYARIVLEQAIQLYRAHDLVFDIAHAHLSADARRPCTALLAPVVQQSAEAIQAMYDGEANDVVVDIRDAEMHAHTDPNVLGRVLKRLLYETAQQTPDGTPLRVHVERSPYPPGDGAASEHQPQIRLDVPLNMWNTLRAFSAAEEGLPEKGVPMKSAILTLSYWIAQKQVQSLGGTLAPSRDATQPALILTLPAT